MSPYKAIANGGNDLEKAAAIDAVEVQDAVNLVAIVGSLHEHLINLGRNGMDGNMKNNHPVTLAFLSKLNSLCRMDTERELAAHLAVLTIASGGQAEYEVLPL